MSQFKNTGGAFITYIGRKYITNSKPQLNDNYYPIKTYEGITSLYD
ncbi:hypothetical protein [Chryseobacterium sp. POE27]